MIFEISPPILYELGLDAAMEWLAERLQEQQGITVEVEFKGKERDGKGDLHTILFQAVRELLTNIRKHSQAKNVKIHVIRSKKEIKIAVQDDGVGFVPSSRRQKGSVRNFGLFNIEEQLKHIRGKFEIVSSPGKGTTVTLIAPINSGKESGNRGSNGQTTPKNSAGR